MMNMQYFNKSMALLLLLGFCFPLTILAQLPSAAQSNVWNISNILSSNISMDDKGNTHLMLPILNDSRISYTSYFGFYTTDGHSFILAVVFLGPQSPVIWSANPDNPVSHDAILNFTGEGDLLLHDGDGTTIWSTATSNKSVANMSLASGNLVLFDENNSAVWQSFDHPTDTLVMGQSLCRGMNLSAKPTNTKWPSSKVYLSAEWNGLQYSFEPAAYTQLFQTESGLQLRLTQTTPISTSTPSTCYAFVNGSLGFPEKIFTLPSASSLQFMRLESDGHLRLYELKEPSKARMLFDVLSMVMDFCDYPLACGDYGVCNNGQCSCPSFSHFRFQNDRLPGSGCIPVSNISCNHAHEHQLIPLNDVSYFSYSLFLSKAISGSSQTVCMQSCLLDCSCKVVLFQNYGPGGDGGYCLLLSEQKLILFAEDSTDRFSAFVKIQGNRSDKRRMIIIVTSTVTSLSLTWILVSAVIWKKFKNDQDQLLDSIPGTPKRFSFNELKVATSQFSVKLGCGGFGSVFQGRIGNETIAVKRLEGVEQGMEEFLAEVKTIGTIHHLNLVRLVGFCAERSHKLLVYEYMSNGSLDKWIFDTSPVFSLSWKTRRNIIMAIARGLSYLHEECKEKIAHLDIKPQNILVDENFNAKLSDFGLSKMINRDQSKVMTRMRGTRGYLAPEWLGSKITEKADIYSFGIVMIEMICGRRNLDESQPEQGIHLITLLQEKARSGQLSDLVDSSSNDMKFHVEEVMETMKLAMWCLQVDSSRRPLMSTVAKVLEGEMNMDATPDCIFVASFGSSNPDVAGSTSSYVPSESHLSAPR
ncbi:hypothetical protein SEVIR_1G131100v4 [Setaria viridis]|uniref:Receptor-like serine/threonine-protein kinase n=2 Tax=Setaria viridis TaxID=4556 RepID=A0A4U6WA74_SETVI|nr:G-type lectin S-receptor-like serine/threonine-protein kinase SD2-5 isoform X1 [Setaria viridis]TKW38674.1 hypothetical protein SEVIR_1G131100v2 [Setaria viridis]